MTSLLWPADVPVGWKKWKDFSGPWCKGRYEHEEPPHFGVTEVDHLAADQTLFHSPHWDRVSYLTAMVESGGRFGTCIMYDGTGITAGIHQAVAVYPRNLKAQGPLWKLLWRMDNFIPLPYFPLWGYLEEEGWQLGPKGLTHAHLGRLITGREIRVAIAPNDGKVPRRGRKFDIAEKWLNAMWEIFEMVDGRRSQVLFGLENMMDFAQTVDIKEGWTIEDYAYHGRVEQHDPFDLPEVDLAMAHFWCNWVNAPSKAKQIFRQCVQRIYKDPVKGACALIHKLGTSTYGRWDDDIGRGEGRKYKSRYQRFREVARDIYPEELFEPDGVMPDDLPG